MPDHTNTAIASQIDSLAEVLQERADVLRATAQAYRDDESLVARLGEKHAGPSNAIQILSQVGQRTQPVNLYHLQHTVLTQLAACQRENADAARATYGDERVVD